MESNQPCKTHLSDLGLTKVINALTENVTLLVNHLPSSKTTQEAIHKHMWCVLDAFLPNNQIVKYQ